MHTAQISGWIGSMLLYEIQVHEWTGCYVMPVVIRLGAVSSVYGHMNR